MSLVNFTHIFYYIRKVKSIQFSIYMARTAEYDRLPPKELINRLRQGDRKAFEAIFMLYSGKVYNTMVKLLNDSDLAEDLVQEIFLSLWEKHSNINPELNFEAYLATIARNMAYHELGKAMRRSQQSVDINQAALLTESEWEEEIDAKSFKEYLMQVIAQFPKVRKEVFLMSRFDQLSNAEIAQQLQISERTVEAHIYKALKELRKVVGSKLTVALLIALSYLK